MSDYSGKSVFGRMRKVKDKKRVKIDGLTFYRLKLECGHSLLLRATVYGPDRKSRRCPQCPAGMVRQ